MEVDFNPRFIPAASVKPALSGLKWMIASQPRVVLRTNPGLSKNVPSGHGLAGWCSQLGTHGFSIQVFWLPMGMILFRSKSSGADTEVRRGRGPREFIDPKGTTGSAPARHPPKPFPEGEIFHSLGLTRSGYPW